MILERDINIITDEMLYVNGKGKRVKRLPGTCLGGFYMIEAAYRNLSYGSFVYIPPHKIKDEEFIKHSRQTLMDKVLSELNPDETQEGKTNGE